jgi:hypothetical protein
VHALRSSTAAIFPPENCVNGRTIALGPYQYRGGSDPLNTN